RANLYADAPLGPLWTDVSKVVGGFWEGAHGHGVKTLDVTKPAALAVALANASRTDLEADRQVLAAAFAPGAPLNTAPLALIVSDALRPLQDKLSDVAVFHDLGCRYQQCAGGRIHSEVSDFWALLGALGDGPALATEVGRFGTTSRVRDAWQPAFRN